MKPWLNTSSAIAADARHARRLTVISSPHVASQRGQVRIAVRGSPMRGSLLRRILIGDDIGGEDRSRLIEQRKSLPDGPGVYLFRDAKGKVIYVGKAKSIREARRAATSPTR